MSRILCICDADGIGSIQDVLNVNIDDCGPTIEEPVLFQPEVWTDTGGGTLLPGPAPIPDAPPRQWICEIAGSQIPWGVGQSREDPELGADLPGISDLNRPVGAFKSVEEKKAAASCGRLLSFGVQISGQPPFSGAGEALPRSRGNRGRPRYRVGRASGFGYGLDPSESSPPQEN